MAPSWEYRNYLRSVRMFLDPELEAALMGQAINDMRMRDLEALVNLVCGINPRTLAPANYRPRI